jgi:hypothetical protein
VKEKSGTANLRWVYGAAFIGIVVFLGYELWDHKGGSEGAKGVANACATIKATGYAGTVKDCVDKMADPAKR